MLLRPFLLTALLSAVVLAGCFGDGADDGLDDDDSDAAYVMEGDWSQPRQPARYDKAEPWKDFATARDGVDIAVGVFLPDIPGCDWQASDLPEECQVPVLVDGGPYYLDSVAVDKGRPQWVEWLVPRGYGVVQMALRGTGESGGCMGFKAPQDVPDVSDTVDWIVEQAWSDGNVALGGRSYDGTTAWAGAASGNPHIKTILPISGAVDAPDLYFRNGTTEVRALTPHIATYWALYAMGGGASDPSYRIPDWSQNVCPEVAESQVYGPLSGATGDASSEYWQSRDLTDDILADYDGSVWVVHGMEDWNVDPSQAVPFVNAMQDAGIPVRAWLGQWGHAYPDHMPEHINVRWDWSDQIVAWLDFYLKGEGDPPWLGVEVEDDTWRWRAEDSYPPRDAQWTAYEDSGDGTPLPTGETLELEWDVTDAGIAAGLARIHVEATPTSPNGGHLFAELYAGHAGEERRIAWSPMNLRFHEGGNTEAATLVPGMPVTARMQTEPFDAPLHEGDSLRLVLSRDGVEDLAPSPDPSPILIGDVTLTLPMVDADGFIEIPLGDDDPRLEE